MVGAKMVHVPYSGGGPSALGVMTNQVQALFSSVVTVLGMLRGGNIKAIAIAADRRSELIPNVPTFAEQGFDYKIGTWYGLLAPAKTPPAIIDTLAPRECRRLLPIRAYEHGSSSKARTWWRTRPPSSAPSSRHETERLEPHHPRRQYSARLSRMHNPDQQKRTRRRRRDRRRHRRGLHGLASAAPRRRRAR